MGRRSINPYQRVFAIRAKGSHGEYSVGTAFTFEGKNVLITAGHALADIGKGHKLYVEATEKGRITKAPVISQAVIERADLAILEMEWPEGILTQTLKIGYPTGAGRSLGMDVVVARYPDLAGEQEKKLREFRTYVQSVEKGTHG